MSKRHIKRGDEVVVIAGNDKGRTGTVLRFVDGRVVVEGVNIRKKHMRKTQENQQGQIIDIECPIHISNVKPFVNGAARKMRVGLAESGEKELYYLEENKRVVYRPVKQQKNK